APSAGNHARAPSVISNAWAERRCINASPSRTTFHVLRVRAPNAPGLRKAWVAALATSEALLARHSPSLEDCSQQRLPCDRGHRPPTRARTRKAIAHAFQPAADRALEDTKLAHPRKFSRPHAQSRNHESSSTLFARSTDGGHNANLAAAFQAPRSGRRDGDPPAQRPL